MEPYQPENQEIQKQLSVNKKGKKSDFMVRKYFVEQVLVKCKGFAKVLVGLCILASFSACDQEMSEPVPQVAKVVDSLQVDPVTRSSARALETTSPGWSEGSYDAFIASKYKIPSPVQINSDYYKFRVTPLDMKTIEVWIKYFSPKGNIVYQQMDKRGSSFEIQRIFQQEGKYSYAFFVKRMGSLGYPRISQQGLSVNVEFPIPVVTDDYLVHMKRKGYDRKNQMYYEQWGFGEFQCVSWVALKVNQMWKTKTDFKNTMFGGALSHAMYWKKKFQQNGYTVDRNPQPGDIIWFPPNARTPQGGKAALSQGHVGFVHEVIGDKIIFTDYNGIQSPKAYKRHEMTLNEISVEAEFIHVRHRR